MDTDRLLLESAERIFADHCDKAALDAAERGEFPTAVWRALADNGFLELALPDSGMALADAFALIGLAGRHAVPLPLAEVLLANRWLAEPSRFVTIGTVSGGRVVEAPWARQADIVLGLDVARDAYVIVEPRARADVTQGSNAAGEPRDSLEVPPGAEWISVAEPAAAYLALSRAVAMAGCLERLLELTLQYAGEREQFGRPIGRFQAIQHNLAVMAGETAAARRAADAAMEALGGDGEVQDARRLTLEVAAAKARVGEAAGIVVEIAHQVHGAMGYTYEHRLHHFTRRAWAWRDEHGDEAFWQHRLGRYVAAVGADRAWEFLATRG